MITTDLMEAPRLADLRNIDAEILGGDPQASVALGGRFEVLRLPFGILGGIESVVLARFRLGTHSLEHISADWRIGIPLERGFGRLAARVTLLHQSSHLGDEAVISYGLQSVEYGHEAFDLRGSYSLPIGGADSARFTYAHKEVVRGNYPQDKGSDSFALDADKQLSARVRAQAGCQYSRVVMDGARSRTTCSAGVTQTWTMRPVTVLLVASHGVAQPGEFYSQSEKFIGVELRLH